MVEIYSMRYPNKKTTGRHISLSPCECLLIGYFYCSGEYTQQEIADQLGTTPRVVGRYIRETYSKEQIYSIKKKHYAASKLKEKNPLYAKRGADTPNWKGGIFLSKTGYLMMRKPDWFTGSATKSCYVPLQDVIYCLENNLTGIPTGYDVHHCDQNKLNNDPSNLILLTNAEHTYLHYRLKGVTTISKESTTKWLEAWRQGIDLPLHDIV